VFLDFDGHSTVSAMTGKAPSAFDLDGIAGWSAFEQQVMADVARLTAEYFSPFNINITTVDPGTAGLQRSSSLDNTYGTRVCFSPIDGKSTGIGYVNLFRQGNDPTNYSTGALVDAKRIYQLYTSGAYGNFDLTNAADYGSLISSLAQTAAHEIGHNMGLDHDGITSDSSGYYGGYNVSTKTAWSPIMGYTNISKTRRLNQWSIGEYRNATNTGQDDLAVITDTGSGWTNGFGYRADEGLGTISFSDLTTGIIQTSGDYDDFAFTLTGAGDVAFNLASGVNIAGLQWGSLYYYADVWQSVIGGEDILLGHYLADIDSLLLGIEMTLGIGDYYLRVGGSGYQYGSYQGFSDYASLGTYTIAASLRSAAPEPATILIIAFGIAGMGLVRRYRR
jgi:hypothetical protein